jgi:hypothetical protein
MNDPNFGSIPPDDILERVWTATENAIARSKPRLRTIFIIAVLGLLLAGSGTAAYAASTGTFSAPAVRPTPTITPQAPGPPKSLPTYFLEFDALPGFVDGGFSSLAQTAISIQWHGPLSARAKQIIADAAAHHYRIIIDYVRYGNDEMYPAISQLSGALKGAGFNAWSLAPGDDYGNIEVSGPTITASDTPAIEAIARATIGNIPIKVIEWDPANLHPLEY